MVEALLSELNSYIPVLEQTFRLLEQKLPGPAPTRVGPRIYPRYREKTAEQAALQKIARYIGSLHAIVILLKHRHLQEDGVLKRTLDELNEDIMFLVIQPQNEKDKALRAKFLASFYSEAFEPGVSPMESKRPPKGPTRKEVRDYNHSITGLQDAPGPRAAQVIYQAYSGYVHSNSPHLMEIWDLDTRRYELEGIKDEGLYQSHVEDAVNYFARGFYNLAGLATALGENQLFGELRVKGDLLSALAGSL